MTSNRKMNENELDFLKEEKDGSVVFTCEKAEIQFPEEYIDHKIAEISGKDVRIFGLFEIKIYDNLDDSTKPRNVFFKHVGKIVTCPSIISDVRIKGDDNKYILLTFKKGDAFIKNKNITVDSTVASTMLNVMTLGYFPNMMPYEEIAHYWADVSAYNGVALDAMSSSSIELIVSDLMRDPKNVAKSFRTKLKADPKTSRYGYKAINIKYLPRYTSVFSSLTAGDPKNNIISMISRLRSGQGQLTSPVEEAIL